MGNFSKETIINTIEKCGIVVARTTNNKLYFLTSNRNILRHVYIFGELQNTDTSFEALNVKTLSIISLNYNDIDELFLICIPEFYAPALITRGLQDNKEIINFSIEMLERFKKLKKELFKDTIDFDICSKVKRFIASNKKLDNLFKLNLDVIDEKILAYEGGLCENFYATYAKQIDFLSPGIGVMLEFFDKTIRDEFIKIIDNKDEILKLAKNSWFTLLSLYREKSLELYDKETHKVLSDTTLTDFEREYLLTSIQTEKEKLQNCNFFEFINLIDDPDFLLKYWPFTNISLESTDTLVTNLGSQSINEKFNENRPKKTIILGTDYFLKLIKIINNYLNEQVSISTGFKLFSAKTDSDKDSVKEIKSKLILAKKNKLLERKNELLEYLEKEKEENEEQDIKDEIQEIINIVHSTQKEIDNINDNINVTDLLEYWPAALYPIPDELDPNK